MRIGLVCPYNLFLGGGVQECVFALQAELQKRGHEARIITPMPRGSADEALRDVIFIGNATQIKSFRTTSQLSVSANAEKIDAVLASEQFDVLHFHEPWVPILSRQVLSRSGAANVATFHARLPETVLTPTIEKVITPYTRSILKYLHSLSAVSESAAEYVRSLTDSPISIIPNGIDLKKYGAMSYESRAKNSKAQSSQLKAHGSSSKTILYIGRLEKRKGLIYLLKAYQQLRSQHPDVSLAIAGDGVDRDKLEEYAAKNNIEGLSFMGYITDEQKLDLLHGSDLFCSPALYGESFGIVLLEAMATGLVTVAGDNDGYSGLMEGRGTLSLVDPKNTADFCRRLELLLYDEPLRQLWKEWAAGYVKQFSYTNIVDQYEQLYLQAMRKQT